MPLVSIDEIRIAAKNVSGVAVRTPLLPALWAGGTLALKPECLQVIGAFKIRGAYHALTTLSHEERSRGVIASSSGNHAQAMAYAARAYGAPATIVIPEGAAHGKVVATEALGARVVRVPPARRDLAAAELAQEHGLSLIPPYEDARVIAGQGTVGLEIVEDDPAVDVVLVPVSGGGLIAGVAAAVKALRPQAKVIGVEPELAADTTESVRRGERVTWTPEQTYRTIADGLRTTSPGALPWEHIQAYVDGMVTVSEQEIRDAMRLIALGSRIVAEPSGAVATAAHLFHSAELPPGRRVAVVSGGNVDPALLAEVLSGRPV
jgi:threonine dehydratase